VKKNILIIIVIISICLIYSFALSETDYTGTYVYKPKNPNLQGEILAKQNGSKISFEIITVNNKNISTSEIEVSGTLNGTEATLSNDNNCKISINFHGKTLNVENATSECRGPAENNNDFQGKYVYVTPKNGKTDTQKQSTSSSQPNALGDTVIRECKVKGFHPRMTSHEASNIIYDLHLQDRLPDETNEDIALHFCRFDKIAMKQQLIQTIDSIRQAHGQAHDQQDLQKVQSNKLKLRRYLDFLNKNYDNVCLSINSTFHITTALSALLFNNQGYTWKKFAKEFIDNYGVVMYNYNNKYEKGVYRYKNEQDGCEIVIHQNLSMDLKKAAGHHGSH
jgi:hypothetical protein